MNFTHLISYFYLVGYRDGLQRASNLVEASVNTDPVSRPDVKVGLKIGLARPTTAPMTRVPASPVV
jgi:hypothetical protein